MHLIPKKVTKEKHSSNCFWCYSLVQGDVLHSTLSVIPLVRLRKKWKGKKVMIPYIKPEKRPKSGPKKRLIIPAVIQV